MSADLTARKQQKEILHEEDPVPGTDCRHRCRHIAGAVLAFAEVLIFLDLIEMTPWLLDEALLFGCVWAMKQVRYWEDAT